MSLLGFLLVSWVNHSEKRSPGSDFLLGSLFIVSPSEAGGRVLPNTQTFFSAFPFRLALKAGSTGLPLCVYFSFGPTPFKVQAFEI